jgi:hypothetical protein
MSRPTAEAGSGAFSLSGLQLHFAFHLPQREAFGATSAQPEVFNSFVLFWMIFCVESKKSAAIESHECFSALRIGTLRDH